MKFYETNPAKDFANKDFEYVLVEFGVKLRKIRLEKSISQEAMALDIGFDRTYISLLERGKRNPSLIAINRLAEYLQIEVRELV